MMTLLSMMQMSMIIALGLVALTFGDIVNNFLEGFR